MPFKNITVFVDLSPGGKARAEYAVKLALKHGSHLVGIFVAPSGWQGNPAEAYVRGHDAIRQLLERHKAEEAVASATAGLDFQAIASREDITFEFRIIRQGDPSESAKLNSLHADLAIVGHARPGGLPKEWSAEALVVATGVPFLMIPDNWKGGAIAERVLLGWNASREARRAITDALPLLVAAQSVCIIVVDPHKNDRHGEEPGADIAHHLSRHGAHVSVEQLHSHGTAVTSVILDYAAQNGIDLIVLGAYSHRWSTELIFGGVTRSMLNNTGIPLLISH